MLLINARVRVCVRVLVFFFASPDEAPSLGLVDGWGEECCGWIGTSCEAPKHFSGSTGWKPECFDCGAFEGTGVCRLQNKIFGEITPTNGVTKTILIICEHRRPNKGHGMKL